MDTVAVTGASSQLGVFLLPRLRAAGYRVDAYSRQAPSAPVEISAGLRWLPPQTGGNWPGARYLISCGPLELATEIVSGSTNLEQVVAFSTTSVLTKADSGNRRESALVTGIRDEEQRLRSACADRGAGLLLLRPTLIYGCGLDRNISLLARFGRKTGFIPVAANAEGLRQPVHADDLAALAVRALGEGQAIDLESAACGGSTLSFRQMAGEIAACYTGVRTVSLPAGLLRAATTLASLLPAYGGVNAEMVRRQARDLVFDDSILRQALDYRPRPFRPGPGDFEIPAEFRSFRLG